MNRFKPKYHLINVENKINLQTAIYKLLKEILLKALNNQADAVSFKSKEEGNLTSLQIYRKNKLVNEANIESKFIDSIFQFLAYRYCEGPNKKSEDSNFPKLEEYKCSIRVEDKIAVFIVNQRKNEIKNLTTITCDEAKKQFGLIDKNKENFSNILSKETGLIIVSSMIPENLSAMTATMLSLSKAMFIGPLLSADTIKTFKEYGKNKLLIANVVSKNSYSAINQALEYGYKFNQVELLGVTCSEFVPLACVNCKEDAFVHSSTLANIPESLRLSVAKKYFRNSGCGDCKDKGYKGYTGIHSILNISKEMSHLLKEEEELDLVEFEQALQAEDFTPLFFDALCKYFRRKVKLEKIVQFQSNLSNCIKNNIQKNCNNLIEQVIEEQKSNKKIKSDKNTLLVIDDDTDLKTILQITFEAENFKVILTEADSNTVNLIESENPDVIICDLLMPDIDGAELIKKIRNNKKICEIPVLILTGLDLELAEKKLKVYKADAVLDKTTKRANIVTVVKSLISKSS